MAPSCQRLRPTAAAGLTAAGGGSGQREGFFDPRASTDIVLRKHEGCDEESARWRVQGALDRVWSQRAAASGCAAQGSWPGAPVQERTSAGHSTCVLAADEEVDLRMASTSKCPAPVAHRPSAALLPTCFYRKKNTSRCPHSYT